VLRKSVYVTVVNVMLKCVKLVTYNYYDLETMMVWSNFTFL